MTMPVLSTDFSQCHEGDFSEPEVVLWSTETFQLLSNVKVSGPIHDVAFSPSAASQLACVGSLGVYFCLIQTQDSGVDLKVCSTRKRHKDLPVVASLISIAFSHSGHQNSSWLLCETYLLFCQFQRVKAPAEVGDVELTALCYHMDSLLFTASNKGHVCVWDIDTQRCFMTWEADEGEIGMMKLCNRV